MLNLAAYIPPNASRVVELGCGKGETGEEFLRIQPDCDYWGVAEERAQVRSLTEVLPHAFCAGPDSLDLSASGCFAADALLVRGSFLAALSAERMKEWASSLAEEGQVIIYVPNGGSISAVLARLKGAGTFEQGMPALPQLVSMASEAGFYVVDQYSVYGSEEKKLQERPEVQAFIKAGDALRESLGEAGKWEPLVKGYLLRLMKRPVPMEERFCLHVVVGESVVTRRPRIQEPNAFLNTIPDFYAVDEVSSFDGRKDVGFGRKICLRQRQCFDSFEMGLNFVASCRKHGYLALHELDDNPVLWEKKKLANCNIDYMGAHALQVSTEALADRLREMNPYIKVFRNELRQLPPRRDYGLERAKRARGELPVTIFFGALNRTHEWQDIMPVLNKAAREYGERVFFRVLSDRGFFEALETEHKVYVAEEGRDYGGQFVSYDRYCQSLHTADISLLPLHDTEFNRTKSDLKFIESAGHGAVVLASPTVYEGTVREGRTGFIYRSPQEFAEKLRLLIEDEDRRIETAETAYAYVKSERLLCQHYEERADWYRSLWDRREELDRALLARLARAEELMKQAKGDKCD